MTDLVTLGDDDDVLEMTPLTETEAVLVGVAVLIAVDVPDANDVRDEITVRVTRDEKDVEPDTVDVTDPVTVAVSANDGEDVALFDGDGETVSDARPDVEAVEVTVTMGVGDNDSELDTVGALDSLTLFVAESIDDVFEDAVSDGLGEFPRSREAKPVVDTLLDSELVVVAVNDLTELYDVLPVDEGVNVLLADDDVLAVGVKVPTEGVGNGERVPVIEIIEVKVDVTDTVPQLVGNEDDVDEEELDGTRDAVGCEEVELEAVAIDDCEVVLDPDTLPETVAESVSDKLDDAEDVWEGEDVTEGE